MQKKHKIAFVGNSIVTMYNFRHTLIEALCDEGYDITVITNADSDKPYFADSNVKFIPINVDSKGINPKSDIKLTKQLTEIYKREQFDFIFHYTIKPVIYGSVAAHLAHTPSLTVITGLGYVFLQNNWLRSLVVKLYRYSCQFPQKIWFLNNDDKQLFLREHIVSNKFVEVIDGEGVDTARFCPQNVQNSTFSFIYIGRLLWAKGIGEYVEAARQIKKRHPEIEFKILGGSDNYSSKIDVMPRDIQAWQNEGIITYLGEVSDVVPYIAASDCVVLPSYYREGVPRTLLEAASMCKPIITTDSIGCRETVIDGESGTLCQPRDIESLVESMERILSLSESKRTEMGKKGRQLVLDKFDYNIIIDKYKQTLQHFFEPTSQYNPAQASDNLPKINASIVTFNTSYDDLVKLVSELKKCHLINQIFVINNGKNELAEIEKLGIKYIKNESNTGYGRAHNIALRETLKEGTPYHIIVNPDIKFESNIFDEMIAFMESNKDVASLMPKVYYPDGKLQYLCKLIPKPTNLFARRFLPKWVTRKSKNRFELRHFNYNHILNVPFLSGCFMLLRTEALREIGLFDERYFLYMEDVDLSRRLNQHYKTIFYPNVSIVHKHAHGSYKNHWLLWVHIINSYRYFNKWGWFNDSEREHTNNNVLEEIQQMQR